MSQPQHPTSPVRDVVVLGAGPTGLTSAMMLARAGIDVVVLDRDLDEPPGTADAAWSDWNRPGVNQFRHVHITLPRWYRVMQAELPEVVRELRVLGGAEVNLLHLNPASATDGWQPGDERYTTVTGRRPVIEAALARVADAEAGVTVRRGCRVTGLVSTTDSAGNVRVVGVRAGDEVIDADLVIDAGGRRTPVPGWLAPLGVAPLVDESVSALSYYSRHYAGPGGPPVGSGPVLTHHESFSMLTLPADGDVWGVAIVVAAADRSARALQDAGIWEAAARACLPDGWLAETPITGVRPFGGLRDIVRDYAPAGVPVLSGLVPVGDAWAATNPFLGRGLSLGTIQATVLRDAVADAADDGPDAVCQRYAAMLREQAEPYVRATVSYSRHRAAQLAAEATGQPYRSDDPAWAASSALTAGLREDPALLRAYHEIAGALALPDDLFADPGLRARLGPWFGLSPYPADRPGRSTLLDAIARRGADLPDAAASRAAATPTRSNPLEGALS